MDGEDKQSVKLEQPTLTKKQELNNHIVLMRKVVRRARLHLINKLTKEVKKLKVRKGDPKIQEKAKRKAERIIQEIQLIKHLKEDKVSIYALQDTKTLEETLQSPESKPEDRAIARLSHHQFVSKEVAKYRESNPYWTLQIPVLLEKSKEKRRQINKKLAEREAAKSVKKSGINNKKPQVKVDDETEKVQSAEGDQSSTGNNSSSDEKEERGQSSSEEEEGTGNEIPTPPLAIVKPEPKIKGKAEAKPKNKKSPQPPKPVVQNKPIGKSVGTIRVQVLNSLTDLEVDTKEEIETDRQVKLTVEDLPSLRKQGESKRPKSSFFVGGVDEPEVEEEAPQRKAPQRQRQQQRPDRPSGNPNSEFKPIFKKGKLINKGPKQRNPKSFSEPGSSNLIPLGNRSLRSNQSESGVKGAVSKGGIGGSADSSEKLHPSWEAKKRLQPTLSQFQGKKITFADDD